MLSLETFQFPFIIKFLFVKLSQYVLLVAYKMFLVN